MNLPALSIKPPWSLAIARFGKDVENRRWKTPYRGPLAIHASVSWADEADFSNVLQAGWRRFARNHDPAAASTLLTEDSPWVVRGAVVAVAELTGICDGLLAEDAFIGDINTSFEFCTCGDWAVPRQFHWKLADVRPLPEPVPVRGALKLWGLPPGVRDAVQAQL